MLDSVKKSILISASIFTSVAAIAKSEIDACNAFSQAEMKVCLLKKQSESERKLSKGQQDLLTTINRWDEDDVFVRKSKDSFIASQKEFLKYQEAYCGFNATLSGGAAGNSSELRRLTCIIETNNAAVVRLRKLTQGISTK